MNQLDLTLPKARELRDAGMKQALDHAEAVHDGWKNEAYTFLLQFAKEHREFQSEDVGDAHKAAGHPQPPTRRAWGSLYVKAAREGYIVQDGTARSRLRHASLCPKWRSLVYRSAA